ncbi:MAG TPA: bifunctional phosphoribosylaminoimidazolecarboxamide formyltransferase/IMP cyclohydrolase [Gammaproteobacteria bacterium]|jgi:phosphoribosylaminoimidazolecarboxamide formyltransferase/IMP cyclohydrolase|nr:bifunctional phosphoribosylaminoimidazolecarboxamide formyltransferase/IMP cyclohydrolase [Gammaproteobacteria bacterium]
MSPARQNRRATPSRRATDDQTAKPRRRALLSVANKQGLEPLAAGLAGLGFEIVSTGGTAKALRKAGVDVTEVATITGFPEIMDGRVKTLHPHIHGGLLARRGVDDAVLAEHGIGVIDLLVVNLYPFEATAARPDCTDAEAIENIDVGGPAMLRAAAKNHEHILVVVDPADYAPVLAALAEDDVPAGLRRELAIKAFSHTSRYDAAISAYLRAHSTAPDAWPDPLLRSWRLTQALRYGENPHQHAALYRDIEQVPGTVAHATQVQGKELSFNNIVDADAAYQAVKAFEAAACVIVKHANPCGAAVAATPAMAYQLAYRTDPTSAYGGVIAFNRPLDQASAEAIVGRQFAEVIIAPEITKTARAVLAKKPAIRVLEAGWPAASATRERTFEIKTIEAGALLQDTDRGHVDLTAARVVTHRAPTTEELRDLQFAWTVVKYVKSNAIVYTREGATLGIGAGQPSRVMSARIAALKAEEASLALNGAAMASDAFFPFRDGIDAAAERGIRAVVQPGGSMRDEEVVQAANEHGMAMVFTGMRHFRH